MRHRKKIVATTSNQLVSSVEDKVEDKGGSHFPCFITSLSVVQIILYIVGISDSLNINHKKPYQVWRYFTLALVHEDELHLLGNLSLEFLYGIELEKRHGWKKVSFLFFGGTIFGELLGASLNSVEVVIGIGASTGVSALIAGYIASSNLNGSEKQYSLQVIGTANILLGPFILLVCHRYAYNACTILKFVGLLEVNSYFAHIGGTLAGILVGIPILCQQNTAFSSALKLICLIVGGFMFIISICISLNRIEEMDK